MPYIMNQIKLPEGIDFIIFYDLPYKVRREKRKIHGVIETIEHNNQYTRHFYDRAREILFEKKSLSDFWHPNQSILGVSSNTAKGNLLYKNFQELPFLLEKDCQNRITKIETKIKALQKRKPFSGKRKRLHSLRKTLKQEREYLNYLIKTPLNASFGFVEVIKNE